MEVLNDEGGTAMITSGATAGRHDEHDHLVAVFPNRDDAERAVEELRAGGDHAAIEMAPLRPGEVLVAVCSHGRAGNIEEIMTRHGGTSSTVSARR